MSPSIKSPGGGNEACQHGSRYREAAMTCLGDNFHADPQKHELIRAFCFLLRRNHSLNTRSIASSTGEGGELFQLPWHLDDSLESAIRDGKTAATCRSP
jgi:hypothetical protein